MASAGEEMPYKQKIPECRPMAIKEITYSESIDFLASARIRLPFLDSEPPWPPGRSVLENSVGSLSAFLMLFLYLLANI